MTARGRVCSQSTAPDGDNLGVSGTTKLCGRKMEVRQKLVRSGRTMMVCTLVIYDIVEDKARRRIAEVCKDYGLERVQYSAFFGLTDRNRREEMMLKFRRILGDTEGNIQMYVICEKDIRLKKELSVNGYDPYRAEELRTRAAG